MRAKAISALANLTGHSTSSFLLKNQAEAAYAKHSLQHTLKFTHEKQCEVNFYTVSSNNT